MERSLDKSPKNNLLQKSAKDPGGHNSDKQFASGLLQETESLERWRLGEEPRRQCARDGL